MDAELVRACLEGREGAWEALLAAYGPFLRRLIARKLARRAAADADAVFQDLWVSLVEDRCRRLKRYDTLRPLKPYLATLALNLCREHLARESRRPPRAPLPEAVSGGPAPGEALLRGEEARRGQEALRELPPRERLAWILVEQDGLDYASASRILRVAEGTVGSLLTRGRERLRKIVESPQGPPPPSRTGT